MASYQQQPFNEYSTVTGGGFDNSQASSGKPGSAGGQSTATLTPVTIKQILEARQLMQDGPYVVSNIELHNISFVGVVRNVVDHTANVSVTVEDGTGQIEFRQWSNDQKDMERASQGDNAVYDSEVSQQFQIGTYVKVFATLREFGGKMNIQYAIVKRVDNFNEVIAHHLSAMKCFAIANGKMSSPQSAANLDENSETLGGQSLFVQDNDFGNGKPVTQRILDFCRDQCRDKDANTFSVHTKLISQSLGMLEDDVRMHCQTLTEQGFIYPTFDENSYFTL
ncbi:HBL299Wp [Eremothecium sinecaudum]|uniref:HBL299Wp n=1 Tax=Eremothecium sinecaudum TaxID=45286 RepID=A0A109UW03_9SACH|nr:HBL299Wp [Eremothecium sinecaudum]AMD18603.1 HBL299Wp [Eremothecium sinecaudum]